MPRAPFPISASCRASTCSGCAIARSRARHSRGNGDYVFARQPDLVLFGTPPGNPRPQWLGDRQLEANPSFLADYRIVLFDAGTVACPDGTTQPMRIVAWTRLAGRLGPRPDPDDPRRLVVPGFWLGSWRQPYSFAPERLAAAGTDPRDVVQEVERGAAWLLDPGTVGERIDGETMPVATVRRPGRHLVPQLPLPAGRYRLSAPDLPAGVSFSLHAEALAPADADGTWRVPEGTGPTLVDIVCDVPASVAVPFVVRQLVLHHVDRP
jgi:hypothetical protein